MAPSTVAVAVAGFGQAEVDDPGDAVLRHDHVAGLDIAMEDAVLVGLGQPRCDLAGDLQGFRQPAALRSILSRRVAPSWNAMAMNTSPPGVSSISWITTMLG